MAAGNSPWVELEQKGIEEVVCSEISFEQRLEPIPVIWKHSLHA